MAGLAAVLILVHAARGQSAEPNDASEPEQTAFAIPRLAPAGSLDEITMPTPLSPADAALARLVFADQAAGRMVAAARASATLTSNLLAGPIAADRLLGRFHHAQPAELEAWLARYGTQADAPAIRALLARRLPRGTPLPPDRAPPTLAPEISPGQETDDIGADAGSHPDAGEGDRTLRRDIVEQAESGDYHAALRRIDAARGLKPPEIERLRAAVARALFAHDWDSAALQVAAGAWRAMPPDQRVGSTALVAGLAAWRLDRLSLALGWFGKAARAPEAPAAMRAAGAFWAARTALRLDDPKAYRTWLRRAAVERRTFHGLIARRILGWGTGLILGREVLSQADLDALAAKPRGLRAFALLQVGQTARAEAELRALWPEVADSAPLRRALLLAAAGAHLTDLAAQFAGLVQAADGVPHDALRFPVPHLRPAGGFIVDRALVYGLARTESNFDPAAVSPAGARGLLQIMPLTARAVSGNHRLATRALANPSVNLGIGQRELLRLAAIPSVDDDLIRLLGSYNDGPAGFAAAMAGVSDEGDPLMFIEAIPIPETRAFVQRVLANSWIYAARLGLPAPGLDDLASGRWPRLVPANWTPVANVLHARGEQQLARGGLP